MPLEPLQTRQVAFRPALGPMHVMALLVGHQNDEIRRPRQLDRGLGNGWSGNSVKARNGSKTRPSHQQVAACGRSGIVMATGLGLVLANGSFNRAFHWLAP